MCPLCWAALVAQVLFWITVGLILVVITDLKLGLPLSLLSLVVTGGNLWGDWGVPVWVFYGLGALLLGRGAFVLWKHSDNWVRQAGVCVGGWAIRVVRPIVYGSGK
ncbi:MAG: hypothetical protein RL417_1143 [Pseudomonadota bacterium]|jgi:hypothetical protein